MVSCLAPRKKHTAVKNLLTNCGPLSDKTYVDMSKLTTQWSKKILAICAAVVLLVRTAYVNLEYHFFMTRTCWLPFAVSGNGPNIFMAKNSNSSDAKNSCIFCLWLALIPS